MVGPSAPVVGGAGPWVAGAPAGAAVAACAVVDHHRADQDPWVGPGEGLVGMILGVVLLPWGVAAAAGALVVRRVVGPSAGLEEASCAAEVGRHMADDLEAGSCMVGVECRSVAATCWSEVSCDCTRSRTMWERTEACLAGLVEADRMASDCGQVMDRLVRVGHMDSGLEVNERRERVGHKASG